MTSASRGAASIKSFIENSDDTVKRMKLYKLTGDLDGLVGLLQDTTAKLEPGLANIDFDALNQTRWSMEVLRKRHVEITGTSDSDIAASDGCWFVGKNLTSARGVGRTKTKQSRS